MSNAIRPFARPLILCDWVVSADSGKTDLYGLFNAIDQRLIRMSRNVSVSSRSLPAG